MKRKIVIMLVVVLSFVVVGCGKIQVTENGKRGEQDKTQNVAKEKVLRFSWWGGDERNRATLEVIRQFEALNPGVTIEAEYGGSDGYHDKLSTQLASGTAPDIIQVDPETFPQYVSMNDYFIDYLEQDVDVSDFEESYIRLEINGRYNGKQLGLPSGISGGSLLVNKKLADEIGIDFSVTYTWDDLFEFGKRVRAYDEEMYLLCMNKEYVTNLIVFNYGKQLAGDTFCDAEAKKMNITEEQLTEVYAFVERLYKEGVIAPASYQAAYSGDNLQSDPNWIAGKYVAAYTYISTMDVMAAANEEATYYAGQLPVLDGATEKGWVSNTPQVLAVTKAGENQEIAIAFINYFFNDPEAQKTLGITRSVPPTRQGREIAKENGLLSEYTMEGADIAAMVNGSPNDKISSVSEAKAILCDAVESLGYSVSDPKTQATNTIKLFERLLK